MGEFLPKRLPIVAISENLKYLKKAPVQEGDNQVTIVNLFLYLAAVVAVVAMWRGLWGLMDIYLWPNNPKRSNWASFIIGFVIIAIALALITQ